MDGLYMFTMEHPIKMDDLGVAPLYKWGVSINGGTHKSSIYLGLKWDNNG